MSEPLICVKCGSEIEDADSGMASCQQCGEVVFSQKTRVLQANHDPDLNDIAEFAKDPLIHETSQGGLVYNLTVSGLDTLENRETFFNILKDPRLNLDVTKLRGGIKEGILEISHLNPVKTTVIVSKMKHLPLKITWVSHQLVKGMSILVLFFSLQVLASEWGRHEVNLKGYASRILTAQEEVEALIKKKKQNKDPKVRDEILHEISVKNGELKKLYNDFKREKEHVRFQHPEQDDKTERRYRHLKLKSAEELEKEAGLDGELSRLKKKIDTQYPTHQD